MSEIELKKLNPNDIAEHPLLANISSLSAEKYEVIKQTIASGGIQHPVACIRGNDGKYLLIDGRHRIKAAREICLDKIPAFIHPDDTNVLDFILNAAVTGRQLTKSGIALTLFECNPALIENRRDRKGGYRHGKKSVLSTDNSSPINKDGHSAETEAEMSFRELAEKYHVPQDYFSRLATIKEQCRPWPNDRDFEWKLVKRWIFEDEMGITRLLPALEGYQHMHSIGKDKTQIKASGKLPTNLQDGFLRSFSYLRNQFPNWETLARPRRNILIKTWFEEVLPSLPEELRHAQQN